MVVERVQTEHIRIYSEGTVLTWERTFDAPRELVWQVMLDPEAIPSWWGPHRYTTTVEEMDVRVGGKWRFVNHSEEGDFPFWGEYLELDPPRGFVQTFTFPDIADTPGIEHYRLEEIDGKTRLTSWSDFGTPEVLEGAIATGMVEGGIQAWERLAVEIARRR
jgi:uncharacterized protein YndB with AHSA1/START domain